MNSTAADTFGGGEAWVLSAARGLQDRGHRVWVGGKAGGRLLSAAETAGLQTAPLTVRGDLSPAVSWRIARFLRAQSIDTLVCGRTKDLRVAGLGARWARTPVVLARHGAQVSDRWRHRLALRALADGIVTNARSIEAAYHAYGWFDDAFVSVVYNGVEVPDEVRPFVFPMRNAHTRIVLAAGRFTPEKGFDRLIDTAALLRTRGRTDLHLVLAGDGRLRDQLVANAARQGVASTVHFVGYQASLWPMLAGCDLFVLPSLSEGMPNVVMEAMAMGTPVVATGVGGVPELIDSPACGMVVPPGDPDALARAIVSIDALPDRGAAMGAAARDRVRSSFSRTTMLDALERLLHERLSRARRQ